MKNDGGNTAHNARNAVIGRLSTNADKTGMPASATRTFSLGGRKEKIAALVQKFLAMCPNATDDRALEFALSGKRLRNALEARLRVRVPVERDHGFRWKMITQSGGR